MAGYQINQLPRATSVTDGDLVPVYVSSAGGAQAAPMSVILAYLQDTFADPTFALQTATPSLSGFTATISSTTSNTWLQLAPTTTLGAGTIRLPAAASSFDGMMVLITSTQQITSLTITSTGATAIVGAPVAIARGGYCLMRFSSTANSWYCIGGLTNFVYAAAVFLLNSSAQTVAELKSVTANTVVNWLTLAGNETGSSPIIGVDGIDANISIALSPKGTGTVNLNASTSVTGKVSTTLGVTVPTSTVAGLPAASANANTLRIVTDASAPAIGNVVAGGGAVRCLVNSDGTNWRVC